MTPPPFGHSSNWLGADFRLHTRAVNEFVCPCATHADLNAFVGKYIDPIQVADIRLGMVTNHNKLDANEFRAFRKCASTQDIYLLPRVELSVSDGANGIHVLVVFSAPFLHNGGDHINPFIGAAFLGRTPTQCQTEKARSNDSQLETLKKLESFEKTLLYQSQG